MRVLVACECSGVVREAFRAKGNDAWSCDLEPAKDGSEFHLQCDVLELLDQPIRMLKHSFQLLIAHPPCDYLTNSAAWAFKDPDFERYPGAGYHQKVTPGTLTGQARRDARYKASEFFMALWNCGIERVCMENPIGHMSGKLGLPKPQIIQPWQFGDDASKATCLWLKGLPELTFDSNKTFPPRYVCQDCGFTWHNGWAGDECSCGSLKVLPRWSNQTNSGQNKLPPSKGRAHDRAVTYSGIAKAMAEQWNF